MRIRYRAAIVVALLVLVGAGAWLALRPPPPEPVYDGQPLSYWLSQYARAIGLNLSRPANQPQTIEERAVISSALFHIGTNALPTLSKMLRARDSALKLKFIQLAGRQHVVNFHFVPALTLNTLACGALQDMGDRAVFAVPVLAEVYAREVAFVSNQPGKTDPAAVMLITIPSLLGSLGPLASNAVPALALGMSCTNYYWRLHALIALGEIHSYPDITVPALIQGLHDPDANNRSEALLIIQQFGSRAALPLPALFALLQEPDFKIREYAISAILQIKPRAEPSIALPALIRALGDPDVDFDRQVLSALKFYGPDAKPAVPAILDLLHRRESNLGGPDAFLRSEIKSTLDQIDPAAGLE